MSAHRRVVLIMGPPGAGKSTLAETYDLTVHDRDEPPYSGDEAAFRRACAIVGRDPRAQAVVIRTGATPAARHSIRRLIRPTEEVVLDTPADVCIERIHARGRGTPADIEHQVRGVVEWWSQRARGTGRGSGALGFFG